MKRTINHRILAVVLLGFIGHEVYFNHELFPRVMVAVAGTDSPGGRRTASLPPGVKVVWDLNKAYRETTPTRERICINGLWRWQPAEPEADQAPAGNWGYFKVPGCWPGVTNYMQKDNQTVRAHPDWSNRRLGSITATW